MLLHSYLETNDVRCMKPRNTRAGTWHQIEHEIKCKIYLRWEFRYLTWSHLLPFCWEFRYLTWSHLLPFRWEFRYLTWSHLLSYCSFARNIYTCLHGRMSLLSLFLILKVGSFLPTTLPKPGAST